MSIVKNISKRVSDKRKIISEGPSISLITKGEKVIVDGVRTVAVPAGQLLYMPAGTHYFGDEPFEETSITFSPGESQRLLAILSEVFGMPVDEHEPCPECLENKYIAYPAWREVKKLFTSLPTPAHNSTIEQLKKMELLALLAANPKCCIQRCLLNDSDPHTENFEHIIRDNIFRPLSLVELARLTNRSVTSFKSEFRRRYHESPHIYITRQRLAHARMLLISTSRPIADIGAECTFANPSHFIKLFGKEYGITPANYRKKYFQ
jgi:AraC-like DNA-binding protein